MVVYSSMQIQRLPHLAPSAVLSSIDATKPNGNYRKPWWNANNGSLSSQMAHFWTLSETNHITQTLVASVGSITYVHKSNLSIRKFKTASKSGQCFSYTQQSATCRCTDHESLSFIPQFVSHSGAVFAGKKCSCCFRCVKVTGLNNFHVQRSLFNSSS